MWWLEVLKKLIPTVISVFLAWLKSRPHPQPKTPEVPAPKPPEPKPEPVPLPPAPEPEPEPEPLPPPPPPPPPPQYDSGVFEIPCKEAFFAILVPSPEGLTDIKHKDGSVVLIGTHVGDDLFIDNYYLQKIGTARVTLRFNTGGERVLRLQRDGATVASMPIIVTY